MSGFEGSQDAIRNVQNDAARAVEDLAKKYPLNKQIQREADETRAKIVVANDQLAIDEARLNFEAFVDGAITLKEQSVDIKWLKAQGAPLVASATSALERLAAAQGAALNPEAKERRGQNQHERLLDSLGILKDEKKMAALRTLLNVSAEEPIGSAQWKKRVENFQKFINDKLIPNGAEHSKIDPDGVFGKLTYGALNDGYHHNADEFNGHGEKEAMAVLFGPLPEKKAEPPKTAPEEPVVTVPAPGGGEAVRASAAAPEAAGTIGLDSVPTTTIPREVDEAQVSRMVKFSALIRDKNGNTVSAGAVGELVADPHDGTLRVAVGPAPEEGKPWNGKVFEFAANTTLPIVDVKFEDRRLPVATLRPNTKIFSALIKGNTGEKPKAKVVAETSGAEFVAVVGKLTAGKIIRVRTAGGQEGFVKAEDLEITTLAMRAEGQTAEQAIAAAIEASQSAPHATVATAASAPDQAPPPQRLKLLPRRLNAPGKYWTLETKPSRKFLPVQMRQAISTKAATETIISTSEHRLSRDLCSR